MVATYLNLSLSNIINVTVQGTASGLGLPNINTIALISSEVPAVAFGADYLVCKSLADVTAHYATSSEAYLQALAIFSQNPNPLTTGGYLVIIPLTGVETPDETIARVKDEIYFFGCLVDDVIASLPTVAAYMQTLDKIIFVSSATAADYAVTTGKFDVVRAANQTHTRCLYHSVSAQQARIFAASYAGRALSTAFSGVNTTQTMHLKVITGFTGDPAIDQTELTACVAAGVDFYASFGVDRLFTSGLNTFFDEIYNQLWFKLDLQTNGFNFLAQINTKIPQSEIGIDGLKNTYRTVCEKAGRNRFIGPGAWTSADSFGDREALIRNIADVGYYIYSLPVSQQSTADREARKAPLTQIAVKSQGAVHSSDIIVSVNL